MKSFNSLLFLILLLISGNLSAQNQKERIRGEYSVHAITPPTPERDTIESYGPVRMILPRDYIEFNSAHTLKLKWNKRFTITNSRPIPAYGLNIDNATIHGTYKVKNDTLILTYRYTIQHFSKLSPKSRVKGKYNQDNRPRPVKRFARTANAHFQISNYGYWYKKED